MSSNHYGSELIIEMLRASRATAWKILFPHGLQTDAESIANIAVLKTICSGHTVRNPVAFACKVARRDAIKLVIRESKFQSLDSATGEDVEVPANYKAQAWEVRNVKNALPQAFAVVRDAVRRLPHTDRVIVLGHSVLRLDFHFLAQVLGSTPGAVKKRWYRALLCLHGEISKGINGSPLLQELFGRIIDDDELFGDFFEAAFKPEALMGGLDGLCGVRA